MDEATIFLEALQLASPGERAAFLDQACGGNDELRRDVELLLKAHVKVGDFLAQAPAPAGVTVDQPITESPGMVIGPYKLIEQIGEGGMGTVWMAQQTEPVKRVVALKLIKAGMDSRQVFARFEAERQALALMDHANIARVLDAGTASTGRPYFVMDLVKGVPITKYCDEQHLTLRQRLEMFIPVCQAVQHAHQKGVIHRDLKPSNVLVALYDDKAVPKVIDFGVAKATGQQLTEKTLVTGFGAIVGTLEYMSPEQAEINQLDIDTRSDIYSLGVLLYELLAGSPPFTRKELEKAGMLEMLRLIREEEPSKPSTKLSTAGGLPALAANRGTEPAKLTALVRGDLDWIVMKALEKDRNRRYETANGFAMDVESYLADEPVSACPPSTLYRLRKFVRRNKGPVLAASLVLAALVAGIVGTTWESRQAEQARQAEASRADGERMAKERAEANFALANEAVERYLGTVTEAPELKQADFHRLRKNLLEGAIPFFQKIAEQKSEDPAVEAGRGRAYGRLGDVRHAMGEYEPALQDFEAARAIFSHLAGGFPTVPAYRHGLAMSLGNVGHTLHPLGKREEAEAAYRQALDILEKLAADFPTEPLYRHHLAECHNSLGSLMKEMGKYEKAEAAYRRAIDIREKLANDIPGEPVYRKDLAGCHNNLGLLLAELGKFEKAEAAYLRALDIKEKLVADFPLEPMYLQVMPQTHLNLGNVLTSLGKNKEAETSHREALSIYAKLVTSFPTVPDYRTALATCHYNLGIQLVSLGKLAEAESAFGQALGIWEKLADGFPTVPEYRSGLALSYNALGNALAELGRNEKAEEALRQAVVIEEKIVADFPNVLQYGVALGGAYCNIGILIRDSGQTEASLDWFQKAIARLEGVLAQESRLTDAREFLRNSHGAKGRALGALGRHVEATREWELALEADDGSAREQISSNIAVSRLRAFLEKKDAASCLAAAAEYENLKRTDAAGLYDAACNRALCAAVIPEDPKTPVADAARLTREQADLAMAWLSQAVAAGFTDAAHMKRDADLDSLREREDFRRLLAELEAK